METQLNLHDAARLRLWNPLAAEDEVTSVVRPVLEREMPVEIRSAGPWVAAKWAMEYVVTEGFTSALGPLHQRLRAMRNSGSDQLTISARRRYSMMTVPTAVAMGAEAWVASGKDPLRSPHSIALAVEGVKGLASALQDWRLQAGHKSLVPTRAESDGMIPLLCLWSVAGPAAIELMTAPEAKPGSLEAVQELVRYTAGKLPERAPGIWSNVDPITVFDRGDGIYIGNWVGYGMFPLDPMKNPKTLGGQWSQPFLPEPMFLALRRLMEEIGRHSPVLVGELQKRTEIGADVLGVLSNLGSDQSVLYARKYFSTTASYSLGESNPGAGGIRGGDPLAGPRVRSLQRIFEEVKRALAEKGTPITAEHLTESAAAAHRFDSDSWKELSTPTQAPDVAHDASMMLCQSYPWAKTGKAQILGHLTAALDVRLEAVRIILGAEAGTPLKVLQARWARDPSIEKRLREMDSLHLLHRITIVSPDVDVSFDPDASRSYWRNFLTRQPNPYCRLTEPENLIRGLAPIAYAQRLQEVLTDVWSPGTGDAILDAGKQQTLGAEIWRIASDRVRRCREPQSYEEAILGAALTIAQRRSDPGFGVGHAFALAYQVGMGSGRDPRLADSTGPARVNRVRMLEGKGSMEDGLVTGSSSVVSQLLMDWSNCAKASNADASLDPRLKAMAASTAAVRVLATAIAAKNTLSAALKLPACWDALLVKSPEFLKYVSAVANDPSIRPRQAMAATAGAWAGPHPFLTPAVAHALSSVQAAGLPLLPMNLEKKPAKISDLGVGNAIFTHAVEAVAPMLDAFAIGRKADSDAPRIPQQAIVEMAGQRAMVPTNGNDVASVHDRLCADTAKKYPQFRFDYSAEAAPGSPLGAVGGFLTAEGMAHRSLLNILTKRDTMLPSDELKEAHEQLVAVFTPFRNGALGSNYRAVVWAVALERALQQEPQVSGQSVEKLRRVIAALNALNGTAVAERHRSRTARANSKESFQVLDLQYGDKGAPVAQVLREIGPLPATVLWNLRTEACAMVTSHLKKEARGVSAAHLGPGAEKAAQAAVAAAVLSGIINARHGAAQYVTEAGLERTAIGPGKETSPARRSDPEAEVQQPAIGGP